MNIGKIASIRLRMDAMLLALGIIFMPMIFSWLLLRRGYSYRARFAGFAWMACMFWVMGTGDSSDPTPKAVAPSVVTASQQTAVAGTAAGTMAPIGGAPDRGNVRSAPPKKAEPAAPSVAVQRDTRALAKIETRLARNADLLKSSYATPEMVDQAASDLLLLAMAQEAYGENGVIAQEKELGRKATALMPRARRQTRELYASALELIFVRQGLDIAVDTRGEQRNELRVICAVMTKPLVYQFQNELGIREQAENFGFSRIVYTNGFEGSLAESWTVDLARR